MTINRGIIEVPLRPAGLRWIVAGLMLAALGWIFVVSARHALAETIIAVASRYPVPAELFARAVEMEPSNPQTYRSLAIYTMDVERPPDLDEANRLLAECVLKGPNRVQSWIELGRNRELSGKTDEAEQAYLTASRIAPSFWKPQWALGNLYIRLGRTRDGVNALALASDRNPDMTPMIVHTVWRATEGDVQATTLAAGSGLDGRMAILGLLLDQNQIDAAMSVWMSLVEAHAGDPGVVAFGNRIAWTLVGSGRSADAMAVWSRDYPDVSPVLDGVSNAGFDDPVSEAATSPFRWMLQQNPDAHISVDAGRESAKSLRIDYKLKGDEGVIHAREFVQVRPGANYLVSFWCRTDDLVSGGLPEVACTDPANHGQTISARLLPVGTTPWTQYSMAARAPASGLISIEIRRNSCGADCPVFGTIRIDDIAIAAH